jgi:hypothetical protein
MISTKDIVDLETKYSKYIFKKRVKYLLVFSLTLLVIAIPVYLYMYKYKTEETKRQTHKATQKQVKTQTKQVSAKTINEQTKATLPLVEKPKPIKTANLEDTNKTKAIKAAKKPLESKVTTPTSTIKKKAPQNPLFKKLLPSNLTSIDYGKRGELVFRCDIKREETADLEETTVVKTKNNDKNVTIIKKEEQKPKIDIVMRDIDSIKYLNKKFQNTHDIVFALMLCESYYKQKDYKNSLKWSIIANDIDSSSERSWIWFAKSKYRLHHKNDAIKALKSYLATNSSSKIKSLLRDIVNGELND